MLDDAIPGTDGDFFAKDLSQVGTLHIFGLFFPVSGICHDKL